MRKKRVIAFGTFVFAFAVLAPVILFAAKEYAAGKTVFDKVDFVSFAGQTSGDNITWKRTETANSVGVTKNQTLTMYPGATVTTGKDSYCVLRFHNKLSSAFSDSKGTVGNLVIEPNSTIEIVKSGLRRGVKVVSGTAIWHGIIKDLEKPFKLQERGKGSNSVYGVYGHFQNPQGF